MSASNPPRILSCPGCGNRVKWSTKNPNRPFCSERCRLIDLGAWADESNRIAGNASEDDVLSGQLDQPPMD